MLLLVSLLWLPSLASIHHGWSVSDMCRATYHFVSHIKLGQAHCTVVYEGRVFSLRKIELWPTDYYTSTTAEFWGYANNLGQSHSSYNVTYIAYSCFMYLRTKRMRESFYLPTLMYLRYLLNSTCIIPIFVPRQKLFTSTVSFS